MVVEIKNKITMRNFYFQVQMGGQDRRSCRVLILNFKLMPKLESEKSKNLMFVFILSILLFKGDCFNIFSHPKLRGYLYKFYAICPSIWVVALLISLMHLFW